MIRNRRGRGCSLRCRRRPRLRMPEQPYPHPECPHPAEGRCHRWSCWRPWPGHREPSRVQHRPGGERSHCRPCRAAAKTESSGASLEYRRWASPGELRPTKNAPWPFLAEGRCRGQSRALKRPFERGDARCRTVPVSKGTGGIAFGSRDARKVVSLLLWASQGGNDSW